MEVVLGAGHLPVMPGLAPAPGLLPGPAGPPALPCNELTASSSPPTPNNGQEHATALLTVRVLMQGKEVGSIIGKRGDNIKRYREESGAKINISDGSCPERIVTVTGTPETIHKAFCMICGKFEEDLESLPDGVPKPPVTLRLLVPATQCGSIIGRGGTKIREIREATGASIQVAGEALPQSSERAVTVSGTADSICRCILELCRILLDSPPKVQPLLYRPKPAVPPIILPGGQTLLIPSQLGPVLPAEMQKLSPSPHQLLQPLPLPLQAGATAPPVIPGLPGGMVPVLPAGLPGLPGATPALPHPAPMTPGQQQQSMEMSIPNELIGCVIGRQGQKIQEISSLEPQAFSPPCTAPLVGTSSPYSLPGTQLPSLSGVPGALPAGAPFLLPQSGLVPMQHQLIKPYVPLGVPGLVPASPQPHLQGLAPLSHEQLIHSQASKDLTTKLKPGINQLPAKFTPY